MILLDRFNNPVAGETINVSVTGGIGTVDEQPSVRKATDSAGRVYVSFKATSTGEGTVRFEAGNLNANYSIKVVAPQVSGTSLINLEWLNKAILERPWDAYLEGKKILSVKVYDQELQPIPDIDVRFAVTNSSVIELNSSVARTNSNGIAIIEAYPKVNGTTRVYAFAGDSGEVLNLIITNVTRDPWVYPSWGYRVPIYIEELSGNNLVDYQVLITLDASFNWSHAKSDGSDIRFADKNGDPIPYWVESWNYGSSAKIWVKLNLTANDNKTIYMYYGNSNAFSESDANKTFKIVGEAGTIVVGGNEVTVGLNKVYNDPVVFGVPVLNPGEYRSGGSRTQHHLITEVGNNYFKIKQVESPSTGDGNIESTAVNYIVLESGTYYIGTDTLAEVGKIDVTGSYKTFYFSSSFTQTPAVISDLQRIPTSGNTGYNDSYVRIRSLSSSSFDIQIERDDNYDPGSSLKGIAGYAAIEQGIDAVNKLEANNTGNSITHSFTTIPFSTSYSSAPIVVAQLVSDDGYNSFYAVLRDVTPIDFELAGEEPASWDGSHTTEVFSWVSVPSGFIYGRDIVNPEPAVVTGKEEKY